jgi:catechol 2,3-dioxygenase-like lactoylglutathione lyase family enzyme
MKTLEHGRRPVAGFAALAAIVSLFSYAASAAAQSATAQPASAQAAAAGHGKVVGMAFIGRSVSDLDKSVAFYKALGFTQDMQANPAWRKDAITEQIYGIKNGKGVETRMAKMAINSNQSGQVFNVYLREFRGLERKKLAGYDAWEPGAAHFGLVVPDAEKLWAQLKASGQLKARSWGGELITPPGQTKKMLAYLTDPDGLDIEIIDQRPATPPSNGNPGRPAMTPGISHVGLVILDSEKARGFYEKFMGGTLVNAQQPWLQGDFYDSAIGAHWNILRFFNEGFAEVRAPDKRLNLELVEFQNRKKAVKDYHAYDVATQYVGIEVENLDAVLAGAKAAGAKAITLNGVATMKSGTRVAIVRDPDVGGFVELYEQPPK